MRRFDITTISLPFCCGDPACSCADRSEHGEPGGETDGTVARPRRAQRGWLVDVVEDGLVVDTFRGYTLNEALTEVHRHYPRTYFDPEA